MSKTTPHLCMASPTLNQSCLCDQCNVLRLLSITVEFSMERNQLACHVREPLSKQTPLSQSRLWVFQLRSQTF